MMQRSPRQVSPFAFFAARTWLMTCPRRGRSTGVSRSPRSSRRSSAASISGAAALSEASSSSSVSARLEGGNNVERLGVFD
jgi:hypothetical protein